MEPPKIRTYRDALRAIWERSAYDRGFISNPFWGDAAADLGLKRTAALLDRLGRPHDRFGIIHVAGSKGKGSTCAFVTAILHAAGHRVGTYTSPHLHSFRERIAVNGEPIAEEAFARLIERGLAAAIELEQDLPEMGEATAFELVTALALDHFAAVGCRFAVVEVGMGGGLDATNVVSPVVSVITALDFEHTRVLGNTLAEIAANKAGIIKPGRPVVVAAQEEDALGVIQGAADAAGSDLLLAGRDWQWHGTSRSFAAEGPWGSYGNLESGLPGSHQVDNALLAIAAAWCGAERGVEISESAIRAGLADTLWPGRFEVVATATGATVVLDGAHTPASARALATTIQAELAREDAIVVLGILGDKDPAGLASELRPIAGRIIATSSSSPRAATADVVAAGVRAAGLAVETAADVRTALADAVEQAGRDGLIVVTGSLTTVAEAREALGLAVADPPMSG